MGVIVSHPRVLKLFYKIQYLSDCIKPVLLLQEVFWREDRSIFRLARLVHGDAVSCSSGWSRGVPVRRLYPGALPGQVNTTSSKSHTLISVFSSIAATYKNNQRDTHDVSLLSVNQVHQFWFCCPGNTLTNAGHSAPTPTSPVFDELNVVPQ